MRVGDDYTATLAVTGYPAEVGPGWLEPLLAYPGRLDVALHIEPIPPPVAARGCAGSAPGSNPPAAATPTRPARRPELDAAADDAADLADRSPAATAACSTSAST